MNKQEFAKFAMALKTFYPKETLLPNDNAVELWYRMLKDISYEAANLFLQKWVCAEKWLPSIADIRQGVVELTEEKTDWSEAWAETRRAVSQFGIYRPQEALRSLSPQTRETVERLGWQELCTSRADDVSFRSNFRDIYNRLEERQKAVSVLPEGLRAQIDTIIIPLLKEGK